jgi:predicted DNA-binding antitoxin AbrB/MazE fold protein
VYVVKARYEGKVLKPFQDLDLNEGDEVGIRVQGSATRKIRGIVKCWEGLEEAHEEYESNIH